MEKIPFIEDLDWKFVDSLRFKRMRILNDYMEFYELPIFPTTPLGSFDTFELEKLLNFCKSHPSFHIVSRFDDVYYNCTLLGVHAYYIAHGDRDPKLAYRLRSFSEAELEEMFADFEPVTREEVEEFWQEFLEEKQASESRKPKLHLT